MAQSASADETSIQWGWVDPDRFDQMLATGNFSGLKCRNAAPSRARFLIERRLKSKPTQVLTTAEGRRLRIW